MAETFHRLVQLGARVWNQSVTDEMTGELLVAATAVTHSTVPLVVVTPDGELVNDKDTLAFACNATSAHISNTAHNVPERGNRLRIHFLMWHISCEFYVEGKTNMPGLHHNMPYLPDLISLLL
jgi:hypothetical protein